jgi:Tfp pilus assembly protein PilF
MTTSISSQTTPAIAAFEKLLDGPRDGALLRFGLGQEYLKTGNRERAIAMFESAVERDPKYSAAWKALGKAYAESDQKEPARAAFERGVAVAEARGDVQAAKEMKVFLRRLDRVE